MKRDMGTLLAIVALFLMAVAPGTMAATTTPGKYTIGDLYRLALERAEKIKIMDENAVIARANKGKALAGLLPSVTLFSSHTSFGESKYTASGTLIQPESSRSYGARVDYRFSLGGREIVAYRIASAQERKTAVEMRDAKEAYLLAVGSSYYDLLRARKAEDIAAANLRRLGAYVQAAQSRLKVGEVTRTVLLRAQSEYCGAEAEQVKAKNILANAKNVLARLVNLDGDFDVAEQNITIGEINNLSFYQNLALSRRDDLKTGEMAKEIAASGVTYARGAHLPYITLSGVLQRNGQEPQSASLIEETKYATASINFPLFEGGLRYREAAEAVAKQRQAQLSYDNLRAEITTEVSSIYNDLISVQGSIKHQRAQKEYAESNFEAVNKQFQHGLASSLDVIDANTLLVSAQRQLLETEYSFLAALLRMQRATGTLLSEVVKEPEEPQAELNRTKRKNDRGSK